MRLTAFLLLAACLHVSAGGYSQRISLAEKNVPLSKIFREIKKQTGISFLYSSEVLDSYGRVSVNVKNATLEETLGQCFRNNGLTWELSDNTIIVKPVPKEPDAITWIYKGVGIQGRVTDEQGQPLAGATILLKGTNRGTQTDNDGRFTMQETEAGAVLEIRFTGYVTQYVKAGSKEIYVSLKRADNKMDEIVVKGYYATSKRLNTGNVSTINAADIQNQPVTNPMQALQGMVPGLFIQQATGMPGAKTNVLLRGTGSITSGTVPLYIIDGVQYNGTPVDAQMRMGFSTGNQPNGGTDPLAQINPADIETIQVLKDADATSIYGSRGANGVIIITTKKAAGGKTRLDINFTQGWGHVTKLVPTLSTAEYLALRKKAFANDGITPNDINGADLTQWSSTQNTNYLEMMLGNTSRINDASVSVSGSDKYNSLIVSGSYHDESSVILGNFGYKKGSLHMKAAHMSEDGKLKMDVSTNFSMDRNRMPYADISGSVIEIPNNYPLYNPDGSLYFGAGFGNPIALMRQYYKTGTSNLILNTGFSYSILPNLQVKANLGMNIISLDQKEIIPQSASDP
ncbi:MAG: TonB-dependent receptor plug domain-containing protein, partial [Bacteroidetes bacterium]|nr:TonB-dependent receptor plug domain-containing protein [Bacteroidota bacterium]